jgi:hypothetical protein
MSSTTVTRGNSHETFYIAPTLTPSAVSANTTAAQTFALPGLQTTDIIISAGYTGNQTTGILTVEADCLTANVLTIQFGNLTSGSLTPASGVYEFQIVRAEGPLPVTAV